jgi:hypothetical protein
MFRWLWRGKPGESAHLRDEELLLFVDGELGGRSSVRVRDHLESCWACRARRQQMESAITEFVAADRSRADTAPPPKLWREFDARLEESLARHTEESVNAPLPGFRFGSRAALATAAILGCLTAATYVVSFRLHRSEIPVPEVDATKAGRRSPSPAAKLPENPMAAPARPSGDSDGAPPMNLAAKAIEIEYALHQARACLGGEVRVLRENGKLRLSGIITSAQRRDQLLAAITDAARGTAVAIDLQLADSGAGSRRTTAPAAILRAEESGKVETLAAPAEGRLRQYLQKHPEIGDPSAVVLRWSGEAVIAAAAATREAWAIRWLAEQYGSARVPSEARGRLDAMLREHIAELRRNLTRVREIVAPAFGAPAGDAASPADPARTWADAALAAFEKTEACERLVGMLFTSEGMGSVPAPRREAEELAAEFLSAENSVNRECLILQRLETGAGAASAQPSVVRN